MNISSCEDLPFTAAFLSLTGLHSEDCYASSRQVQIGLLRALIHQCWF